MADVGDGDDVLVGEAMVPLPLTTDIHTQRFSFFLFSLPLSLPSLSLFFDNHFQRQNPKNDLC